MTTNNSKQPTGLTYAGRTRTWGLRFSVLDGVVLFVSFAVAIGTYYATLGFSLLLLFVVLHFFLFCNVFRIRRLPELIWAGTFVMNCGLWVFAGYVEILGLVATQLVITIGIILYELRMPYYHGIFARQLNPRLDDYLVDQLDGKSRG